MVGSYPVSLVSEPSGITLGEEMGSRGRPDGSVLASDRWLGALSALGDWLRRWHDAGRIEDGGRRDASTPATADSSGQGGGLLLPEPSRLDFLPTPHRVSVQEWATQMGVGEHRVHGRLGLDVVHVGFDHVEVVASRGRRSGNRAVDIGGVIGDVAVAQHRADPVDSVMPLSQLPLAFLAGYQGADPGAPRDDLLSVRAAALRATCRVAPDASAATDPRDVALVVSLVERAWHLADDDG